MDIILIAINNSKRIFFNSSVGLRVIHEYLTNKGHKPKSINYFIDLSYEGIFIEYSGFVSELMDCPDILKILKNLKQAGCSSLLWGIESASETLLKKMGKNIDLKHNFNMLEYSNSIGIKNKIFLMINYPYETIDDLNRTIGFIKRFSAAGNFFLIKTLEIQWDSYIYNNAGRLGIKLKNSRIPNIYGYEEAYARSSEKDIKKLKKYRREILSYDNSSALIKQGRRNRFMSWIRK